MKTLALVTALLLTAAAPLAAATPASPSRPNIILIYSGDHGWADLGAQKTDPDTRTPHLDALARDGVRFVRGYKLNRTYQLTLSCRNVFNQTLESYFNAPAPSSTRTTSAPCGPPASVEDSE